MIDESLMNWSKVTWCYNT